MATRPFKKKFKNVFNLCLENTSSCKFKLTDGIQELDLDNKLTVKVIRSCIMSTKYRYLQPITLQRSYPTIETNENHIIAMLSNIKGLTSVRHKNTILRIINGDWFTQEKLAKIGLIETPKCQRCHEAEDRIHMLSECVTVNRIWKHLYKRVEEITGTKYEVNLENVLCVGRNSTNKQVLTVTIDVIGRLCGPTRPVLSEKSIDSIIAQVVNYETRDCSRKKMKEWQRWKNFLPTSQ
jgi:hypothetical protein